MHLLNQPGFDFPVLLHIPILEDGYKQRGSYLGINAARGRATTALRKSVVSGKKEDFCHIGYLKKKSCSEIIGGRSIRFCKYDAEIIYPVPGGWGKQGWTIIELKKVRKTMFKDALLTSYCLVAPKNLAQQAGMDSF